MREKVLAWAKEKGILEKATREAQMLKTMEEVGELAKALGENDLVEIEDGIGDIAVTLIIQAELCGLNFDKCVETAYSVIAKRNGKMINGLFVKDKTKGT